MTKKNRIGKPGKQKKPSEKQVQCFYCSDSGAGHPNVDFTNTIFGGIEYFPSSHRRQYSEFGGSYPIYFLAAGAKRRIRRFPSRQRRLRRRQPPKTAPRQLHNKSRFFAPWLGKCVSTFHFSVFLKSLICFIPRRDSAKQNPMGSI